MDISDFIAYPVMAIMLSVPFACIYLILYTLNWRERKNLFSESWVVFITWISSTAAVYIFALSAEFGFYKLFHSNIYVIAFPVIILTNIIAIAMVLKFREDNKDWSLVDESKDEIPEKNGDLKILKTSAIVSLLTLAVTVSLIMFVGDISSKIENSNPKPKPTNGYVIYD